MVGYSSKPNPQANRMAVNIKAIALFEHTREIFMTDDSIKRSNCLSICLTSTDTYESKF